MEAEKPKESNPNYDIMGEKNLPGEIVSMVSHGRN